MSIEQVLNRKLECQLQEIEKYIDFQQSFDKINNFIDQVFILDSQSYQINNVKQELSLPKVDKFNIIDQSQFQLNMVQELTPLINQKINDQHQIKQQEYQQSQINSKSQVLQQQHNIISQSQFNLKQFNYQIIQDNSIKQQKFCQAIAFNKDCSVVAAGCGQQINIYEYKQGILKQIQVLNQHKSGVVTLNFMKNYNYLISGSLDKSIVIWQGNNNNQWICSQTIQHNDQINCLIVNNNEDLFISGSNDKSIKFWIKENEWICSQTITDHQNPVRSLSLNNKQNQVISCGEDLYLLIIEYSEQNRNWIVFQRINLDCYGYRLCFINDDIFTFQPREGKLMHVYEMNSVSKLFTKTKDINVNPGNDGMILFPQQYIKSKQLLVNKHDKYINFIRKTENGQFKLEQSIQFRTYLLFGSLSNDGDYLITWDNSSHEIQIRKYREE